MTHPATTPEQEHRIESACRFLRFALSRGPQPARDIVRSGRAIGYTWTELSMALHAPYMESFKTQSGTLFWALRGDTP